MRLRCFLLAALWITWTCWASASSIALSTGFIMPNGMKAYVAQRGDTLQSVSEEFYGNPNHWPDVYKANRERIGKAGKIKKGTLLIVPENWTEPPQEMIPENRIPRPVKIKETPKKILVKKKEATFQGPKIYTVAEGDTLLSIAGKELGDPNLWKAVYKANADKVERGWVEPGQVLVLPVKNLSE